MRAFRVSVAGTMLVVALFAADFAVFAALKRVPTPGIRQAFIGGLLMADLVAACLAVAVSRLARRGEVALPLITFASVGVVAILLLLVIANLAPGFFHEYLDLTAGFYRGPRQYQFEVHRFGMVWAGGLGVLVVYGALTGAVTAPLIIPALLGAWMTRGYRLRLVPGSEDDAPSGGRPGTSQVAP